MAGPVPEGTGFSSSSRFTRTASGEWRCELTPEPPLALELLPDQPFVGFGATRDEAGLDAVRQHIRALHKLPQEQRDLLQTATLEEGARLVGVSGHEEHVVCDDEAQARAWAEERRRRLERERPEP